MDHYQSDQRGYNKYSSVKNGSNKKVKKHHVIRLEESLIKDVKRVILDLDTNKTFQDVVEECLY